MRDACTIWLTGLSGSGKSTIAIDLKKTLVQYIDRSIQILDGDVLRKGINSDLGFSKEDRDKNIFRIGCLCELLNNNGVITIVPVISPYISMRDKVKEKVNMIEIYVKCPLCVCEERDVKGMYKLAREGKIKNFTGISDPYEEPINPNIVCETDKETIEESVRKIIEYMLKHDIII